MGALYAQIVENMEEEQHVEMFKPPLCSEYKTQSHQRNGSHHHYVDPCSTY